VKRRKDEMEWKFAGHLRQAFRAGLWSKDAWTGVMRFKRGKELLR